MPSIAEEYRSRSEQWAERARVATDAELRIQFMDMARQWRTLAVDAELIAEATKRLQESSSPPAKSGSGG